MHPETYTRFFAFIVIALAVGFFGMEIATTGTALGQGVSGMATYTVQDAGPSFTGAATPSSNLLFLFIGILAGAVIVGTAVYIYSIERKRYD